MNYKGHEIKIEWQYDGDCEAPWDHEDGHGPVSDWVTRDKRPRERLLNSDRWAHRFYDIEEATRIAKRDGWGLSPDGIAKLEAKLGRKATRGDIARESVEHDFEYLRRWCNDDWWWCGYVVTIEGTDYHESLWGIDSDSQPEFEREALEQAQAWIDNELGESQNAACRDIVTV